MHGPHGPTRACPWRTLKCTDSHFEWLARWILSNIRANKKSEIRPTYFGSRPASRLTACESADCLRVLQARQGARPWPDTRIAAEEDYEKIRTREAIDALGQARGSRPPRQAPSIATLRVGPPRQGAFYSFLGPYIKSWAASSGRPAWRPTAPVAAPAAQPARLRAFPVFALEIIVNVRTN